MSAWDEQPEQQNDVADLETARLALRGAIQSVRSLQDLNGKLKGEVQDFLHREKALNERLIRLQTELNDSYARLDLETAHDREREAATRELLRQEIVAEQNHKWQSEIDALRQSVQNWTEVRRQKETELKMLKETLLSKEQEVFTLQKEKIAAEENAHREILETIKRSREGVTASVEQAIRTKEKEISDLKRQLAGQPKMIEERMQQIEQDLHRKEQSLLLAFRDRQQSLEMDWAHREKELWEKATEAREALEHELKSQWEERRKTLEDTVQKRQTTLEIQAQQQFEEYQRRALSRDEELHKTWAAKEASLAQEWASREKEMARQFQATLDEERLRASEQAAQLKAETELWRKNHAETLRHKENDFNKAHVENEQKLRNAYRKKEEDLLARHQEALEIAQHQISELMTRSSEKEGFAKSAQDRLTNAVKERDAMADRLGRLEADGLRRAAELEQAIKTRDEELARLHQTFTTQEESRIGQIQALERDQLHKDSELKVLREKILQVETDRKTALEHAVALENEFTARQQQLEEAFRKETETLGVRLAAASHESAERQQTDQRRIAELTAEAQQRAAEIQGLTHQLQLSRHDIEKITQDSSDKQTKNLLIRRQMEERLVAREAELAQQIATLEKERFLIEERLDARVAELEQELGRRLSEDRALQERFRQSEEFRTDLETQADELRDRLSAHEKQTHLHDDEVRIARATAEKERIAAEQKLQSRIGDLEADLAKQEGLSASLQEQLARSLADRQEEQQAAQMREARLDARAQTLEQQLKTQEDEIHARLSAVQVEHARIETALRLQIQEQDAAHMKTREHILGQAAELEGELRRRELEVKTLKDQIVQEERTQIEKTREQRHREAALEERVQFLYKSLEAQKAEHEAQVETTDHAYLKEQDALRALVLRLETDLGRKTTEAGDLSARLTQAQLLHNELRESVNQLEARTLDREQVLRAATQTHLDSEHKLEIAVTELKAAVQKRDADVVAAEKALQVAQRERHAEAAAAALREKQLEERAQTLDDKLHTQKDQITMRLTGVERQRLQNEETLHTRTLDLEQRLAEKTGLVKNLQDQLSRAGSDHEHLEKKMASVEAHLARADQQLKARETEFQSLKSVTQKEMATAQETHQRKLLELQGQRLSLEADLKGLQEALQHTEEEKKRLTDLRASLEERLRADAQAHQSALEAIQKERLALEEAHQTKLLSIEETLAAKTNALQALEHRLTLTEEQRADRENLVALLQKEIHDLQLSLTAQQEEFRSRMAGFDKERTQLQETQQNRITHLESQLQYRESALRSLEEKMTLAKADHDVILEAATEREAVLSEKTKTLETALAGQTKEWHARMEDLLADRMKTETELHGRVVNLQENLSIREKELAVLKDALTQTEATHEALSASSEEAITSSAKERQALEERILAETGRVRDLESQLRGHAVHIKEMEKSLTAGVKEREFLQASLDQLTQRLEEETDAREKTHADKTRALENKMETVEREWRERLEESSKTSVLRVDVLQGKVVELECALGVRENDLSALRQGMAELALERERLTDLVSQKEQERRTLFEAAAHDKEEFAARLAAVQSERKTAEETLNAQLKNLRETLEQKLTGERQRSQSLDTQLAAQISELRQLRAALMEAKDERERLLSTLAGEREKVAAEFKARDQSSVVLEADLRKEMQAQQDEFKAKLAAADKEAARQLALLQARASELEKALVAQRAESEERAAILKSEKAQSLEMLEARLSQDHAAREKGLQHRMLELRDALAARVAEGQALSARLRDTEQERAALDQYSTASHAESTLRREELERQLAGLRDHEQRLETQCTAQISELKQLQSALQDLRAERETLLSTLAAEREKTAQELKGRQKAAAEIETALRTHFETQMTEARARFDVLQKRALELEEKGGEKQAAVERLQAALKESEQARIALERYSSEHHAESASRQAELEKQALAERQRVQALETQLNVQLSELQALRGALNETTEERERVLQTLAEERAQTTAALKAEKDQAATLEKEFRARLAATHTESSQRQAALQARLSELEKGAAEKQASLERLAEVIAHEEAKRAQAEKQWGLEVENRRAAEALAARQKTDFDAHLAALQAERKLSEDALHARLLELRDTLAARAADVQKLEIQLKETEQARAALDYYSTASHTENVQKRDALEGELRAERAQFQELATQLAAQQSELKQLRSVLEETTAEREQLLRSLADERAKAAEALKLQKNTGEDKEKEFRERLAALDGESEERSITLQARIADLEKSAAIQRSDLEQRLALLQAQKIKSEKQLQVQLSELQTQLTVKRGELEAIQHQLLALQKEQSAFTAAAGEDKKAAAERLKTIQSQAAALEKSEAEKQASLDRLTERVAHAEAKRAQAENQWAIEAESRRAAEALAARQKTDFDAHLAALQAERKLSEDALHARLLELRGTLAARAADIQQLEAQLKETEQARAALDHYSTASHAENIKKHDALEGELRTERAQVQALDTQLAAQHSELSALRGALEETRSEREQLLKALAAERQKSAEALKLEKNSTLASEKEFRERLTALDRESERQLLQLRSRTAELEKNSAAQRSELEQRIALLQAEKTTSDKQLQIQLSEWQTQFTLKQAELETVQQQLAAAQKEHNAFEAAAGENKKIAFERLKTLQQRAAALEQSEAEKQTALERLRETLTQLQAKCAQIEKQWVAETEERHSVEALAAQQKKEFEARLAALAVERKTSEAGLHERLLEVRDVLAARVADNQKLEFQLKETEQARAAVDHYSAAAHDEATRRRNVLEQQLAGERERAQALETSLTTQVSELKQLQQAFENARAEREQLMTTLAETRDQAAAALKGQEILTIEREAAVRSQMEAQEKEFRLRLAGADQEMARRLSLLQARTAELEKTLAAQRSDFEQRFALAQAERGAAEKVLQAKISDIHAQWVARSAEFHTLDQERVTVQKERDALASASADQKKAYVQQLEALRQRARDLERGASEKQAALQRLQEAMTELEAHRAHAQAQWDKEAEERRQAQEALLKAEDDFTQRLATVEAGHRAAEEGLHERLIQVRAKLDQRLNAENDKNQNLTTQLAAQMSELKQLRVSLEETRGERAQLLAALAAEREKTALELKDRETLTTEQKRHYEQRLASLEKEFRERLAAADADAARRFSQLQARTVELEKTLAAQHSDHERQMAAQRSDYEQRLAVLQAEQSKADKTLQGTLSDLQAKLALRTKEMEAVQERLTLVQTQRQQWELSLSTHETESLQERRAFEERLSEARARASAVELELKTQTAAHHELQDALTAARKDGAALANMVEDLQKKMQVELSLRETATAEQKKQYEARLAALEKDLSARLKTAAQEASLRMAALQSRAAELEKQGADKQALVERLEASLSDLEAKRAHLETQWMLEAKERRAVQDAAARDKENFDKLTLALAARAADVQRLERQLKDIKQERAALEQYSTASHTDHTQRLSALQTRAAELEKALMAQGSEYEDRFSAFQVESIKTEKTLKAQISQLQTHVAAVGAERDATLQQVASLDKEKAAHTQRLDALQKHTLILEQDAGQKQAALERLQTALNQVDAQRIHWEAQHALRIQENQALQKDAAREKDHFTKQYTELRAALEQRALDVQSLEDQLQHTEESRAALERQSAVSLTDFEKQTQALDRRWSEEKARVHELDLLIKAHVAQIKDLKEALFAEQKQYKNSVARNDDYEQRIEEWRRRTSELERLGEEKQTALDRLRDALLQAEAKKTQAEHQKEELALRLETAQSERKAAEDQLHIRLNDLRLQLEHRVQEESGRARELDSKVHVQAAELERLRKALAEESQERERLTKTLAAERERALAELKGREKTSTETKSHWWTQMEAQEKEFRFQLATVEEESSRRIGLLQARAAELEKTLAAQRAEFEQRLSTLQKERSDAEEKLHVKIISLEEALNRRIAEAQALHAEFSAVESARLIAEGASASVHDEMGRQQKSFDERLAQEHAQARTLEQELQQYKSKAREWKEALEAGKDSEAKRQALQNQLTAFEKELAARDRAAVDLRKNLAALEEERDRLETSVQREEEEKKAALERAAALEARLEKTRHDDLQAEQKLHAHLVDLQDQLERKGASLNVLEDRLQQLQKSNEDLTKALSRDNASWTRQKQELEEKLMSERARLRDLETEQVSQNAALRDLQEALAAAEKERQHALDGLKTQKERFLSDLAQRDTGTAQRHRALELEREALDKQWQERLKAASHETLDRMETLKRRADELEKQLAARQAELKTRHDQVATLEADRRTLNEQLDRLNRDRREESDAAAVERARLLERARALEERLKEQSHELTVQLESVEETREKTKETLEQRLAHLQEQLVKRTAELKNAQERLRVVEESRAHMEKEAGQGQSQLTRERAQLEERLAVERGRAKELSSRLNDVTAKMRETQEALAAAEEARQAQRQELAARQESEKALKQRIQSLERDVRSGVQGTAADASTLENDLAARDAEIERLREEAAALKTDMEQRHAAEIEKRVSERLREQMMNVLETGKLKNGDSTAMQALLEEWVFGFAHQVRNPLGIIRSVAESLLEAARRQTERDSLSAILKAVDGLNLRLREFIEFSKPVKPLLQVLDIPSAVAAAVRLIEEKSLPANVSIHATLPPTGTRVWMDPDHLRTMLVQLLRNAVESMPKGGRVQVAVAFDAGRQQLEIRVRDEGVGISNGHLKEVGRPFFSTKPGAVGLGLALIKRLLRAYDGKLDIESHPGHSTTMICRMKAKQEEAGQWAA